MRSATSLDTGTTEPVGQNLTKLVRRCDNIGGDARIEIGVHNPKGVQLGNMMPTNLQGEGGRGSCLYAG